MTHDRHIDETKSSPFDAEDDMKRHYGFDIDCIAARNAIMANERLSMLMPCFTCGQGRDAFININGAVPLYITAMLPQKKCRRCILLP